MELDSSWSNDLKRLDLSQDDTPAPDEQLLEDMHNNGIAAKDNNLHLVFDGKIHRFALDDDTGGAKTGWYVAFGDNVPAAAYGSWRDGESARTWHARGTKYKWDEAANIVFQRQMAEAKTQRAAEQAREAAATANRAQRSWAQTRPATDDHPYLKRKQVRAHGLHVTGGDNRLIIPISVNGTISSLQYIDESGKKQFATGGAIAGGYFEFGSDISVGVGDLVYIAEGYATAASIYEATGCRTYMGLNAGNLVRVAQYVRKLYPKAIIVIVADNDKSGVGQRDAKKAAGAVGGIVKTPGPLPDSCDKLDANDFAVQGGDLQTLLHIDPKWTFPLLDQTPLPPTPYLIANWLPKDSFSMIYGDSGAGKSFLAIDMFLPIAIPTINSWHGIPVRHHGFVLFLLGEGVREFRKRLVGYAQYHHITDPVPMLAMSLTSWDLDDEDGYNSLIADIESQPGIDINNIVAIVIDTLNRFMAGDENSAQDARLFVNACSRLQRRYHCHVCALHHVGVNPESQWRARGSSAFRGALDTQIRVTAKEGNGCQCIQLDMAKQKDGELVSPLMLKKEPIKLSGGWVKEDGTPETTLVLADAPEATPMDFSDDDIVRLSGAERLALGVFYTAACQHGILNDDGEFAGLAKSDWQDAYCEQAAQRSASTLDSLKRNFRRVVTKLISVNLITAAPPISDDTLYVYVCDNPSSPLASQLTAQIVDAIKARSRT